MTRAADTTGAPDDAAATARREARKVRWGVTLGLPFLALLGRTWRVEEVNDAPWRALGRAGKAFILSSWHGQLLPHIWANRGRGLRAMVSQHGDGEIIARIMERIGFQAVRGSTTRGGRAALVTMIRELEAGRSFAITPDGPRGPAGVPQPGVLMAAERARVPIVPIRSEIDRYWKLGSWDGFELPKPFARIRVIYGDPYLPAGTDADALAELARRMGPAPTPRPRRTRGA